MTTDPTPSDPTSSDSMPSEPTPSDPTPPDSVPSDSVTALLVVDAANTVGSVPDGWWRNRRAAAERLRDRLVPYATEGLPELPGPLDIVLVVEGAARGVESVDGVRVESGEGSGDDWIVRVVAERGTDVPCVVVTADRELRHRVAVLGARCVGPRTVYRA